MSTTHVILWRHATKERVVAGFGGGCNRCGYNKCRQCLDCHHVDPSTKKFSIGSALKCPKAWDDIVSEVKKCILLCRNCHGELHAGLWTLDTIEQVEFKDLLVRTPLRKDTPTGKCPICGVEVFFGNICCSYKCAGKRAWKTKWPTKAKFIAMLAKAKNRCAVARLLGVSEMAVRKREKKLGITFAR